MNNRNNLFFMSLYLLTMLSAPRVWADDDCQTTFSSPVVDFGQIRQDDVVRSQQGWLQMPSREVSASVHCSQAQTIALFIRANAGEQRRFLFGDNSGIAVRVGQMIVDGHRYAIGKTTDRAGFNVTQSNTDSLLIRNNEGITAVENNTPVSGRQMNFTITLTPVLNNRQFSQTTDVSPLESNLVWETLTH
ncbi:hypothetical protein E1B77_12975 [Salmonella enterica subsp. enterica]|nr:hypothetical protein [Salmonella enterica subsp. enterica]